MKPVLLILPPFSLTLLSASLSEEFQAQYYRNLDPFETFPVGFFYVFKKWEKIMQNKKMKQPNVHCFQIDINCFLLLLLFDLIKTFLYHFLPSLLLLTILAIKTLDIFFKRRTEKENGRSQIPAKILAKKL